MSESNPNGPVVSHGRGGAANLSRDSQPYADAGIVREIDAATPVVGSTGRGGTGNIAPSPSVKAADKQPEGAGAAGGSNPGSTDSVPELNVRQAPANFHVGRGGEGNEVHNNGSGGGSEPVHHHEGAAQRFKEMLLGKEGKP